MKKLLPVTVIIILVGSLISILIYEKVYVSSKPPIYSKDYQVAPEGLLFPELKAIFLLRCSEYKLYEECLDDWRYLRIDLAHAISYKFDHPNARFPQRDNLMNLYK